jgi:hypothetical protein
VICRPFSSARFANVCRNEWNVLFSSVGPTRGIGSGLVPFASSAIGIAG